MAPTASFTAPSPAHAVPTPSKTAGGVRLTSADVIGLEHEHGAHK